MSHVETIPARIARADHFGRWESFRVDGTGRRVSALHEIAQAGVPVCVGPPGGPVFAATLWAVDSDKLLVHFHVDPAAAQQARVSSVEGLWAATYLGDTKLQFPLEGLSVEPGEGCYLMHADLPQELYRLPRRRGMRLRRSGSQELQARLRHPLAPDLAVNLSVLDISLDGCALWRPRRVLPLVPEQLVREVEIVVDDETLFFTDLEVRHVSADAENRLGYRVGCLWRTLTPAARAALQGWIETGQRQRARFTLQFD